MNRNKRIIYITQGAVIAALYVVLVAVTNVIPGGLNYGVIQCRLAEALCILPVFTPAAIPGLFIGCLISNFMSPLSLWDLVFGSGATLIAALITYKMRDKKWAAPIPAVVINAVVIGMMIFFLDGGFEKMTGIIAALAAMGSVFAGQLIACMGLGYPLMAMIDKNKMLKNVLT